MPPSPIGSGFVASNDSDLRPLIGITTYVEVARYGVWETDGAILPRVYFDAVARAGGVPVLIPPIGDGQREIVGRLDGLVLSGGADIDPARYGAQAHEQTRNTRPERDEFEAVLLTEAMTAGLPVFAVCRGLQLLNVALGGTLTQHLPDALGHNEHLPTPGTFGTRRIDTRAGSVIARIAGAEVKVHCHHHQAIDKIAPDLRATAWAEDGTIEAVEMDGANIIGVQWHPEEDATDDRLFAALVDEARRYRLGENA